MGKTANPPQRPEAVAFDVWGCRGSRNFSPPRSSIANLTSCYSLLRGRDLMVFDAGRGLSALGHALRAQPRFAAVRRVHVLVTHAHMDHWEGLKDVEWFWRRGNALEVAIYGSREALDTLRRGFEPPSYVPLELLAQGTLRRLRFVTLEAGQRRALGGWTLRTFKLYHYSGNDDDKRLLDALGYRLSRPGGPSVAYISDHEPGAHTVALEAELTRGAHLALYDAHFPDVRSHMHGHGSQEHAAGVARARPGTLVLAGHHGPLFTDAELRGSHRRFGRGLRNFELAVEGRTYVWDAAQAGFTRGRRPLSRR